MNHIEAKLYLKGQLKNYLEVYKGVNTRKPFNCLNPNHTDRHPSMKFKEAGSKSYCKCFPCEAHYDIFNIIGIDYGLDSYREQFLKACEIYGITVNKEASNTALKGKKPIEKKIDPLDLIDDLEEGGAKLELTEQVIKAHEELLNNPAAMEYIKGRGISKETIDEYMLGFAKTGANELLKAYPENMAASGKIGLYNFIHPYKNENGGFNYFLAEISDRSQVDAANGKYRKIKRGETDIKAELFNERYIRQEKPPKAIFICEGIYDALSVEEAGGKAMALVGTAHRRLLSLCKKYRPNTVFVISLDNDKAGKGSVERLKEGFKILKIPYIIATAQNAKDFNEALIANRREFMSYIKETIEKAAAASKPQNTSKYLDEVFYSDIAEMQKFSDTKTGFEYLDEKSGGLFPYLYIITAESSLGKTTFALQIADNLAAAGKDVIFYSLEQSRFELVSKSLARINAESEEEKKDAMSSFDIRKGEGADKVRAAINTYKSRVKDHISIYEGNFGLNVNDIKGTVEAFKRNKINPVLIIDYIQILQPPENLVNRYHSDKEKVDYNVTELRRLSRDYKIPIIAISSVNRTSYFEPLSLNSLKESGSLEYTADSVWALQLKCTMEKSFIEEGKTEKQKIYNAERKANPRKITLSALKNRNGTGYFTTDFIYYPNCDCYEGLNDFRKVKETPFDKFDNKNITML